MESMAVRSTHIISRHTCSPQHTCRTIAAAAPQLQQPQQPLQPLRDWIHDNGGYIHPSLQLADHAPVSKCRGVIATSPISLENLESGPVISVPQDLQFTSSTALSILTSATDSHELVTAAQEQLSNLQLTAAALAVGLSQLTQQRSSSSSSITGIPPAQLIGSAINHNSTSSSFWFPYLVSLPAVPPNPWLIDNSAQVLEALTPYAIARGQTAVAGWAEAVADQRQQMLLSASEVEKLLRPALGITKGDVMTAFGHVMSRSLTSSSSSSGLVPFVDLLNHNRHARAPMLQLDDDDKLVITVLPIRDDEAVPLAAGDELLISYQGGYSPLEAFLKFGFVAEEWWDGDS